MGYRKSDRMGTRYDSPAQPRLVTKKQEGWAKRIRDELSNATEKEKRAKVSLPKFSWDKKNE